MPTKETPPETPPKEWTYRDENESPYGSEESATEKKDVKPITWTASEFVVHHKGAEWYLMLIGGVFALCGLIYIFTKDMISVVAIFIVVILYLIISKAKPRQRTYGIDDQGISIDEKFYPFNAFKSFALSQEGAICCIHLIPLKRLMPELSIYFAQEQAQGIIEILLQSLPHDQSQEHGMDRLAKRLRL